MSWWQPRLALIGAWGFVAGIGCSGNTDGPDASRFDAGADAPPLPEDSATGDAGSALPPSFGAPFAADFGATSNDPRSIQVSISSEDLGQRGFDYTATPREGDIVFVDGWELRFERILVTVANVRLNGPGASPSDQSAVGALVASRATAFAVDVHKPGPLTGAGGAPETAIPLFSFRASASGGALDPMVRYAFSYDTVAATAGATNVNLDAGEFDDYREMISRRWTQLYVGTATYRGVAPAMGSAFGFYPTTVRFRLGFGAAASLINCYNPDNGGDALPGVAPSATARARAQITLHTDHAFWSALNTEDPPLHFDPYAARATDRGGVATVTLDDLVGVAPSNLRDRMNRQIADRGAQTSGYTARDPLALSYEFNGASGIRDLRDFVAYSARSNGHMNADGLCLVRPTAPLTY